MSGGVASPRADGREPAEVRAEIARKVEASGTSFYWAMKLLPPARRDGMFSVYAFCREVDDIADEGGTAAEKRRDLAEWRVEIDRLFAGEPRHPIARALLEPTRAFALRREDYLAVIDGMAMDAEGPIQAPDMATLDLYCDRVASAVGRLSVRVFGCDLPAADEVAHHLGRALQLTNILRDVAEDAARDRLYLPRELLAKHGVRAARPGDVVTDPATPAVCLDLARTALDHFAKADAAMRRCPRKPMRPARMMGGVYRALLDRLIASGFRDPAKPVALSKLAKAWLALRHGFL